MKTFYITFGQRWTPQSPHPSGGHRDGWFTIKASCEEEARGYAHEITDSGFASFYPEDKFDGSFYPAGEIKQFQFSSDPAAPLTVEELCANLLAIKPGEEFEIRRVCYETSQWQLNEGVCDSPLDAVRHGFDVRPLPVKKFTLVYMTRNLTASTIQFGITFRHLDVESSSITAAAALAAPQPGETFLAAVPYPEAS